MVFQVRLDISLVCCDQSWDIKSNTRRRNEFYISARPCIILYVNLYVQASIMFDLHLDKSCRFALQFEWVQPRSARVIYLSTTFDTDLGFTCHPSPGVFLIKYFICRENFDYHDYITKKNAVEFSSICWYYLP